MKIIVISRRISILLLLFAGCMSSYAQDDAAVVKDFEGRARQYVSMKDGQGVTAKQTGSPEKLAEQKQKATEKVHDLRPAAKQGDIFSPEIASYFKRQIAATFKGPNGKRIQASLNRAEPLPNLHLEVNTPYPKNVPLQSMPPSLLLNLPQLPKGLQYRIVGSSLVLYDENTSLVADFIPNAIR